MNTNFTNIEVGDYMLNDGTTVSPFEITKEQEDQAIGIVAYLYEEHKNIFLKNGVKAALKAKGIENPKGLVIALKDAGTYEWCTGNHFAGIGYKSLNEQIAYGVDGVETTDWLPNIDDFPAFKAAKEYEKEVHAPKNTTGWYLPSLGEWFCMLDHYEEFAEYVGAWDTYWSSSECDYDYAYNVNFYSEVKFIYSDNHIERKNCVRPVLAF